MNLADTIAVRVGELAALLAQLPDRADIYGHISALESLAIERIPPRLVIFDADDTLIPGWRSRDAGVPLALLPGVAAKLAEIRAAGGKVAIATNQGGPALRSASIRPNPVPSLDEVMRVYFRELGGLIPDAVIFMSLGYERDGQWLAPAGVSAEKLSVRYAQNAFYSAHPSWRKPRPGMLLAAMHHYGVSRDDTLFVGDADSDEDSAEAAQCRFAWACDFFEWGAECK